MCPPTQRQRNLVMNYESLQILQFLPLGRDLFFSMTSFLDRVHCYAELNIIVGNFQSSFKFLILKLD